MHNYYTLEMKGQAKWLWDHAVYLWLGGIAGAALLIAGVAGLYLGMEEVARIGCYIAFPAGAIASGALLLGLGNPMKAMHSWKKPGTSWISRGVLIWTVFFAVAFLVPVLNYLQIMPGVTKLLAFIGIFAGLGVMVYTGFLLSAAKPIAFWSTGILPALFLVSALASGLLAIMLVGSLLGEDVVAGLTFKAEVLLVGQLLAMLFHIATANRVPEGKVSADMLLKGKSSGLFWVGAVIVGLAVPLLLLLFGGGSKGVLIVAAAAALAGNLCLRQVILQAGVLARLKAGRFEYILSSP